MRRARCGGGVAAAAALTACLGGCRNFPNPPASSVEGLRVLGIKAEPPEVAPGATSQLSILAVDPGGLPIAVDWSACSLPPLPGAAVNPDCFGADAGAAVQPVGQGSTVTVTMPPATAAALGAPDATGGVYQPYLARASTASDQVPADYRLRLAQGGEVNHNPTIAAIVATDASGATVTLDPAAPTPVAAGASLSLSATFAPGSVETYTSFDGRTVGEVLTTSWFTTAGMLSVEKTSALQPQTVLRLDQPPAPTGGTIDLWAVTRDERGGTDYTHRALSIK
jgi:hypothetical protein